MSTDQQNLQEQLQALRTHYLRELPHKLEQLRQSASSSVGSGLSQAHWREIGRQAHALAGSGTTFGCPDISAIAREIDVLCQQAEAQPASGECPMRLRLEALLPQMEEAGQRYIERARMPTAPDSAHEAPPHAGHAPLVYLVDDDTLYAENLATQLRVSGYGTQVHASIDALHEATTSRKPDAIIMDMVFADGQLSGAQATERYTRDLHIPVIFLSIRGDTEARLAAIRAGASHYFAKPAEPARLIATLDQITRRPGAQRYRITLVDDDIELSALYARFMHEAGMQVSVFNNPVEAWNNLESSRAELIVLDVDMPDMNGLELAALIRQMDEYNHVPIVFLSADATIQTRLASMHLGADDFLHKPIDPAFLVAALQARAARARALRDGRSSLQRALRDLEFMQDAVNEHAIVALTDGEGRIVYGNRKFTEISGYTLDEARGKTHRLVKSGLMPESVYEDLWNVISSGRVWQGILTNRAKDGRLYDVSTTIVPKLDEAGLPVQYLSIRTDITAIRNLERKLAEREEMLRSIVDTAPICIKLLGLDGQLLQMNAAGLAMIEADTPEQVIGSDVAPIIAPEHRAAFRRLHASVIQGAAGSLEFDVIGLKGTRRTLFTEAAPLHSADGAIIGALGVTADITERKRAEAEHERLQAQLQQSQKMESIGHLTAGVAHDFNNLLGGVLGYAELGGELLSRGGDRDQDNTDKVRKYLTQILTAGNRAKELIAQMLVFSRLSPDTQKGDAPVTLLQPVVKEVVHLLRSSIPSTIEVNYEIADAALRARIQPVHLHQILLNLAINARDAIGEYGRIDVKLAQVAANGSCDACHQRFDGDFVELSVSDSGRGIPRHLQDKIFDPFFTTKEVGKGTGMGLSVVHGIAHALGGHITVDSMPSRGTTMRVLLPAVSVEPQTTAETSASMPDSADSLLSGLRILVVDDEHAMASMLRELLSMHGAQVTVYNEPAGALAHFERHPDDFDLVITDATMPDLSGLDLARGMLQMRPDLPVLLCTGYSEQVNVDIARQHGIAGFMQKPLDIPKLLQWIHERPPASRAA